MGEAIIAFLQRSFGLAPKIPENPMVGQYKVDYTPLSPEEIGSVSEREQLLEAENWVPVNRKS